MRWVWRPQPRAPRIPKQPLLKILNAVAADLDVHGWTVTLVLATDVFMAGLKKKFFGVEEPTDVLAFPHREVLPDGEAYLGDIVISVETAAVQAREHGHSLEREVALLAVHGFLHLLGYDHETDQGEMARLESTIRRRWLTDPRSLP